MKPNLESHAKPRASATSSLARARLHLRQAVGVALTGSLEALNERIATQLLAPDGAQVAQENAYRLREILERDRALVAAEPPTPPSLAEDAPPTEPSDALPLATSDGAGDPDPDGDAADEPPIEPPAEVFADTEEVAREEPEVRAARSRREAVARATPPPGPAERKRPRGREPIRTRTMAKVLVAQGELERALSIYEELAAKTGGRDASLATEIEALRARLGEAASAPPPA